MATTTRWLCLFEHRNSKREFYILTRFVKMHPLEGAFYWIPFIHLFIYFLKKDIQEIGTKIFWIICKHKDLNRLLF